MNHYKNILFDLDGTLIDSKPGILGSVKKAFAELSLTPPSDERLEGFMGPPLEQCFTDVCGLDKKTTQKAIAAFRRYYGGGGVFDSKPYEGIPQLLSKLRNAGCGLGVATSKNEKLAGIILHHCGLENYFECISGSPDSLDIPWTKTDSVRKVMRGLACADTKNTVMVGDRKFDAAGAQEAGIDSVGVLYGYGREEELLGCGFSAIAKDINELGDLL